MAHQHGHHHGHHHHHEHDSSGKLRAVFFINLIFAILELVGGLLTNSMAILSDALHDLGDSMAIGLSWIFERISRKKRDQNFSYGYKRFSLISATISGLILLGGSVIIIIEAVPRFWNPEPVQTFGMLIFSVFGILVNGAAAWKMWGAGNANEKVVKWHLLEDVLGWVAVLVGSVIIHFTDWYFIDPLLSIGIAVFILFGVYRTLSETVTIFLQAVPDDISVKAIHDQLITIPHVSEVHDIHVWTMDGQYNVLSCHLVVDDDTSATEVKNIKKQARHIASSFGINHQTFEVETMDDVCEYQDC
jgi:cobalt-zinc-cadmium efflux system protein